MERALEKKKKEKVVRLITEKGGTDKSSHWKETSSRCVLRFHLRFQFKVVRYTFYGQSGMDMPSTACASRVSR